MVKISKINHINIGLVGKGSAATGQCHKGAAATGQCRLDASATGRCHGALPPGCSCHGPVANYKIVYCKINHNIINNIITHITQNGNENYNFYSPNILKLFIIVL